MGNLENQSVSEATPAQRSSLRLDWKRRTRRLLSRQIRPAQKWARQQVMLLLDRWVLLQPVEPDPNSVLILRLDNIGDFVVWLAAAEAMVTHFHAQGKRVTLLANAVWSTWAEELRLFDTVLPIHEKNFRHSFRYRLRAAKDLRNRGFGTAVQPAHTRLLDGGDAVIRLSGASRRVGAEGTFENGAATDRAISDRWFTELLPSAPVFEPEIERHATFVRALTGEPYQAQVTDLHRYGALPLPETFASALGGVPYFILFPGASFAGRLWPTSRYVELATRICEKTGWTGVVCGGPGEAAEAERLCQGAGVPLQNWVGHTSLSELAAVIAHASLLVGNETSAVHMAAAVGTPSVCITGGGHFGRFMPYPVQVRDSRPLPVAAAHHMPCFHCDWRCQYHPPKGSPVPCIEQVTVEQVWAAISQALGEEPERRRQGDLLTVLQCTS